MSKTGQTPGIGGFLDTTDYHTKLGLSQKTEGAALTLGRKDLGHSTQKSPEALVKQMTEAFTRAIEIAKGSTAENKDTIITALITAKQNTLRDFQASTTTKSSLNSEAKLMLVSNEKFLQRANDPAQSEILNQVLKPLKQLAKDNPLLGRTLNDAIATIELDLMGY